MIRRCWHGNYFYYPEGRIHCGCRFEMFYPQIVREREAEREKKEMSKKATEALRIWYIEDSGIGSGNLIPAEDVHVGADGPTGLPYYPWLSQPEYNDKLAMAESAKRAWFSSWAEQARETKRLKQLVVDLRLEIETLRKALARRAYG
jgi:hypothetical protein